MADLVTLTGAAKRLGCTQPNLSLLKRKGQISPPTHGKKYDFAILEREYLENTDPARRAAYKKSLSGGDKETIHAPVQPASCKNTPAKRTTTAKKTAKKARNTPAQSVKTHQVAPKTAKKTAMQAVSVQKNAPQAPAETAAAQQNTSSAPPSTGDTFSDHRKNREYYNAELQRIKLEKELGQLVPREDVEKTSYALGRQLRDGIAFLPTRLAPFVAEEMMPSVQAEIDRILDDLSAGIEGLSSS